MVTATASSRVAVVTGAAHGIGRATLMRLQADGFHAIGLDIAAGQANEALIACDVTSKASVCAAIADVVARAGHVDVLVNAAGILIEGPLLKFSIEDLDKLISVNIRGPFLTTQAALPHIRHGGRVINVASELAYLGRQNAAAYAATKGAILSLTRSLARELAPDILVNAVAPGPVDTALLAFDKMTPAQQALETNNPLHRIGRPEEIAAVIAFLASPDASFITGQCYSADGGAAMH